MRIHLRMLSVFRMKRSENGDYMGPLSDFSLGEHLHLSRFSRVLREQLSVPLNYIFMF